MKHTIPFYGTVNASSTNTFVSKLINFPYTTDEIRIKFALGHEATVKHRIMISDDDAAPTSGQGSGDSLLKAYGHVDYVVGDDDVMILKEETAVVRRGTYIKVNCVNSDTANHTVNVVITIDDMLIHSGKQKILDILEKAGLPIELKIGQE
jgi:hypothetical protein|tara:strand:- start:6763 stop:7215 length:453 start_codon:yes stop_codon:yes gene_type:complete